MHGVRNAYYIVGEGVFSEPEFLSGGRGCPVTGSAAPPAPPSFKFGRMLPIPPKRMTAWEWFGLSEGLIRLGLLMNQPAATPAPDSNIPAGYTYLGQFIAHEITFDNTQDLTPTVPDPLNLRSPSLDLDCLYGAGPGDDRDRALYDADSPAYLRIGTTKPVKKLNRFPNDIWRDEETGEAVIGDPRNDENLAVAQTHLAFARFHNRVVDELKPTHGAGDLFECARMQVIRHFQWVVLHDYLPAVVDESVLECVLGHGRRWFRASSEADLYMPLEFSAAAFRLGHSMVRATYEWNLYQSTQIVGGRPAALSQLFQQTAASGLIGKRPKPRRLPSDWIIDWRRFYDFPPELGVKPAPTGINMARRIDTDFSFPLERMEDFPHGNLPPEKRSITVRNLLRGLALGLPTGEEAAACIGEEPMPHEEVARGPHREVLSAPAFRGKTPLWYYVLKEAEVRGGGKLGRVGSRIVAETLVGLIANSRYSILAAPEWRPRYGRHDAQTNTARFGIADLLHFAGVVNPLPDP